jgi:hypothetical protein
LLLGPASAVTTGSKSHSTRDHILMSHLRLDSLSVASYDSQGSIKPVVAVSLCWLLNRDIQQWRDGRFVSMVTYDPFSLHQKCPEGVFTYSRRVNVSWVDPRTHERADRWLRPHDKEHMQRCFYGWQNWDSVDVMIANTPKRRILEVYADRQPINHVHYVQCHNRVTRHPGLCSQDNGLDSRPGTDYASAGFRCTPPSSEANSQITISIHRPHLSCHCVHFLFWRMPFFMLCSVAIVRYINPVLTSQETHYASTTHSTG